MFLKQKVLGFIFFIIFMSFTVVNAYSLDVPDFSIAESEDTLFSAYETVLDAERVGANVSVLLQNLTVASTYLSNANIFYRLGDFDHANNFADICHEIAMDVMKKAVVLQNEAGSFHETKFRATVFLSVVGVLFVIVLGYVSWRVFKGRYYRQVLGSKPEVVVYDES